MIKCFYTKNGLNFKNGYATVCAIQSDRLYELNKGDTPSDIFYSEGFENFRKKMEAGEWPRGCRHCKDTEEQGSTSMRQNDANWSKKIKSEEKSLKIIELRMSNACNMACLHCDQVYSSNWKTKLKKYEPDHEDELLRFDQLRGVRHNPANGQKPIDLKLNEVDKIIDDLIENHKELLKIDVSGGEVLMQKQFWRLLTRMQEHPNKDNIWFYFYSNFNVDFDPVELADNLNQYKQSTINISVDAGEGIYSYFRDGDWSKLNENIGVFRKASKNTELHGVITFSIYQMMDIKNIYESMMKLDVDEIKSAPVYDPPYLNPSLIRVEFEEEFLSDVEETYEFLRSCPDDEKTESAIRSLDKIMDYVMNKEPDPIQWESFLVFSPKIDKLWKKDFNSNYNKYKFEGFGMKRVK